MDFLDEWDAIIKAEATENEVVVEETVTETSEDSKELEFSEIPDSTSINDFLMRAGLTKEGPRTALTYTLKWGGILTLGELRRLSKQELCSIQSMGERSQAVLLDLMINNAIDCVFVREMVRVK